MWNFRMLTNCFDHKWVKWFDSMSCNSVIRKDNFSIVLETYSSLQPCFSNIICTHNFHFKFHYVNYNNNSLHICTSDTSTKPNGFYSQIIFIAACLWRYCKNVMTEIRIFSSALHVYKSWICFNLFAEKTIK